MMLEGIETVFDNMQAMMKKLKKTSYEKNMKEFREKNGHFFSEMAAYVEQAEDKRKAAQEMAALFVDRVKGRFTVRGRIGGRTQADMNFFMIYYIFPAILLTESGEAEALADAVCSEWGNKFKDSKIRYADYETIHDNFKDKIFGIF